MHVRNWLGLAPVVWIEMQIYRSLHQLSVQTIIINSNPFVSLNVSVCSISDFPPYFTLWFWHTSWLVLTPDFTMFILFTLFLVNFASRKRFETCKNAFCSNMFIPLTWKSLQEEQIRAVQCNGIYYFNSLLASFTLKGFESDVPLSFVAKHW